MGTAWIKSGQIERDRNDERAVGATARFFVGNTTTPLVTYSDAEEATPHEDAIETDAYGRWPLVIIPFSDSGYDVLVATAGGTQLFYFRGLPNLDPVIASEESFDPNSVLQTGDWLFSPKSGTRDGFVRANGRSIGSATSGATERANADTEDCYEFHWTNFSNTLCPVATGRGASAAADFAANKALTLPDARGSGIIGLDDMGASAASRLGSATFTLGGATTGGSVCGENTHILAVGEIPALAISVTGTPTGSISQIVPAGSISQATGTISQITPAGSISMNSYTPAGSVNVTDNRTWAGRSASSSTGSSALVTVSANTDSQTFNPPIDVNGAAPTAVFNGTPATLTGSFSGTPVTPTFTGGTPSFTGTPTTPTFTGSLLTSTGSTTNATGGAHNVVGRSVIGTFYIRL